MSRQRLSSKRLPTASSSSSLNWARSDHWCAISSSASAPLRRAVQTQVVMPATAPMLRPPPGQLPQPPSSLTLTPLLGGPSPGTAADGDGDDARAMHGLYVSQIATLVWDRDPDAVGRPVVVGLALLRPSEGAAPRDRFFAIMAAVDALLVARNRAEDPRIL